MDKYWEMQAHIKDTLTDMGDKEIKTLFENFEKQWYNIYKSVSVPSQETFSKIDESVVKQAINSVWCADGKHFSDRIWNNKERLVQTINESLVSCLVTGKKTSDLKKALQKDFGVSYRQADTLVRTEMCAVETQAAANRYQDYGLEYYEFLGREEADIGCQCKEKNGKKYKYSEMKQGINAPPLHPNCRCCIIPVTKRKFSDAELEEITIMANAINPDIGIAQNAFQIILSDEGIHGSKQLADRKITIDDAQYYIDTAIICFKQTPDKYLFLSKEGVCAAITNGRIATAYPQNKFDDNIKQIIKRVIRYGR